MDLNSLKTFMDVVKAGSFIAVAKDRRIDPSSVSRSVAALEKELGVRLLQRTTRKLVPTEAGLWYYERVSDIVDELIAAGSSAAEVSNQPQGVLRVTSSVSFGLRCIAPLLPQFLRENSQLKVELILADAVMDCIAEKIDIAIRLDQPCTDASFAVHELIPTSYRLCASPDYLDANGTPHKPGDLQYHNCLRCASGDVRTRWLFRNDDGKLFETSVDGNLVSTAMVVREAALAGTGLALLPLWLILDDLKHGSLVSVLGNFEVTASDFSTAAWFIYPSKSYVLGKVRKFMDYMRSSLPAVLDERHMRLAAKSARSSVYDRSFAACNATSALDARSTQSATQDR